MTTKTDTTPLPCPFCGCAMSLSAVARDWWRVTGDHSDDCILLGQRADAPQTDDQKQLLIGAWNRRAAVEADRQDRLRGAAKMMPSDEDLLQLASEYCDSTDATGEEPRFTTDESILHFARALLSRYGSGQPTVCQECGARGDASLTPDMQRDEKRGAESGQDREDAERWRYIRRKLCLTGNGDGTCAMHAISLPSVIPGWPDPGKVDEFCDAAIDAARAAKGADHA